MGQLRDNMTALISEEKVQEMVVRLAKEIEIDYHGKEVYFICPLKGSLFFISDLMRNINLNQKIDFVYLKASEKGGAVSIVKDITLNIKNKHVIIVEEIIDNGRTLMFLKDRILSADPASLKIMTLLDKPARREIALKPDYTGVTINDRYVVGYGMDSDELGRNYKGIYSFKM
ncbi:MAG: hypoxanthine phosphoribosyltransferase [Bdellovibrionaceae bacterium]|nr:hypoxanthine phosphoribosyltransferase [Pseudobdellovibrionaceae bacterium]